jgi:hypothetical protein
MQARAKPTDPIVVAAHTTHLLHIRLVTLVARRALVAVLLAVATVMVGATSARALDSTAKESSAQIEALADRCYDGSLCSPAPIASGTYRYDLATTRAAEDAGSLSSPDREASATRATLVGGGVDPGRSQSRSRCTGTPMSRPFGWRTLDASKGPEWVPGTVCTKCQAFPPTLFPPGTKGAPGGPWGEVR